MNPWYLLLVIPVVYFLIKNKKKNKQVTVTENGDMYTESHIEYTVTLNFPNNPRAQFLYTKEINSHQGGEELSKEEVTELSGYISQPRG